MKIDYSLSFAELENAFREYRNKKKFRRKCISNGLIGGFLFTFIVYAIFMPMLNTPDALKNLAIIFIISSLLLGFVSYRLILQMINAAMNPKGESMQINIEINRNELIYKTQVLQYHLKIPHFENLLISENFYHLTWSAKKANYLKEIGIISIPIKILTEAKKHELEVIFQNK